MAMVGDYKVGGVLGRGQFATVNLGTHISTGRQVAIKTIDVTQSSRSKIDEEIAIHQSLRHPHVIGLLEELDDAGRVVVVLEHAEGGELFELIVNNNRLAEAEARRLFQQIISAVDFCHRSGVCHRDLKPENILLDSDWNVKLADFGLAARMKDDEMLTDSCGSLNYAAPELFTKGCSYNGAGVDIWSCGVVLYAMLTGTLPFDASSPESIVKLIKKGRYALPGFLSQDAKDLLTQLLVIDPKSRISMSEIKTHTWYLQDLPTSLAERTPLSSLPCKLEVLQVSSHTASILRTLTLPVLMQGLSRELARQLSLPLTANTPSKSMCSAEIIRGELAIMSEMSAIACI
eukprot:TRINITY_DN30166_c0_g1_i1.p1 TRINITY_DN30166_c0_g1~~TRINITY_DN30166_c0_g1_i1.p1  ORF type:complete len:360 (-),score=57.65 TRINITY_DN30166_c0_g1_i1:167-1204(-)